MKARFGRNNKLVLAASGFGMIEVIVSMSVVAILLVTFLTLTLRTIEITHANTAQLRANMYVRELIEIAKDLEQTNWAELPATCPAPAPEVYHPVATASSTWAFATGSELLDAKFTRSLSLESVRRDPDPFTFPNTIVTTGGVCDENTKKIVAKIEWDAQIMVLETYVYNL